MQRIGATLRHAALEDVVMAGTGPYRWETGIDPDGLTRLSSLVAELSGMIPARNKSAVGSDLFSIESGVAAAFFEALQGEEIGQFYAYTPEFMGAGVRVLVGKGSGAANLRLRAAGLDNDASDKQKLIAAMRAVNLTDTPRGPVKFDHFGT